MMDEFFIFLARHLLPHARRLFTWSSSSSAPFRIQTMTATDTTSSVNSSSKSMQTFLDKCALIKKQHRQTFNDFSFLQVSPLAFVKPLRKDDDSDDDVNNKRAKMRANRETKILNELEMCERTGDVVFRTSSKMKNACVFRLNSLSVAEEEERRGRGGREKIIA